MGSKSEIVIGKKFGDWTVLAIDVKNPNSKAKRVRNTALCECKCGKQQYIEYRALYDGRTTNCGCEWHKKAAKKRQEQSIIPIGTQFGELTVIGDAGMINHKHCSQCQCSCGNVIIVSNTHLKLKHTQSCGCMTGSIGANKIKNILLENNINFISEYTFSDFISPKNGKYRFDFAIFKDQNLIELIEFDGAQHFSPQKGYYEGQFETIKEHDKIKNDYCKKHHIKLIRIPYYEIEEINLAKLELEDYNNPEDRK